MIGARRSPRRYRTKPGPTIQPLYERDYRLSKIADRGHVPHAFVPGPLKLGLVSCAECTRYRPYFAHDPDLVAFHNMREKEGKTQQF